jgi:cytochrome c-type biogenesis protein CcmH
VTWALVLVAALAVFAVLVWALKLPRLGWEWVAAALLVGIAGYALQGHPGRPDAPKPPVENPETADEALLQQRQGMGAAFGSGQSWLILADGLSRRGQYASAAEVLRTGLRQSPGDPDLWVALGNALVAHSDGFISPAAQFAFQRAASLSPEHPGPPFFMGLALAQSGRLPEARTIWAELLARAPDGAPWKGDLEARLARLDAMIGQTPSTPPNAAAPAPASPG